MNTGGARTAGVALVAFGLAVMIARYVMLPLDLDPTWLRSVLTGGAIGGVVGGVQALRRGEGAVRWPVALPLALAAAALGVVLVWSIARARSPANATLAPAEAPGFITALPDWPERDDAVDGAAGRLLRRLGGARGEVRVEYGPQSPLTPDELAALIGDLLGQAIGGPVDRAGPVEPAPTADGPVDVVSLTTHDGRVALVVSSWRCPAGPTLSVSTVLAASIDAARALHRRVLAETRCVAETAPAPVARPRFDAPAGFAVVADDADGIGWSDAAGVELVFAWPLHPDATLADKLASAAPLRDGLIGLMVDAARPLPDPPSQIVDGVERRFWSFEGVDRESRVALRAVLGVWRCPARGGSQTAMYVTTGEETPADGAAMLGRLHCP